MQLLISVNCIFIIVIVDCFLFYMLVIKVSLNQFFLYSVSFTFGLFMAIISILNVFFNYNLAVLGIWAQSVKCLTHRINVCLSLDLQNPCKKMVRALQHTREAMPFHIKYYFPGCEVAELMHLLKWKLYNSSFSSGKKCQVITISFNVLIASRCISMSVLTGLTFSLNHYS